MDAVIMGDEHNYNTTFHLVGMHWWEAKRNHCGPTHTHKRLFEINWVIEGVQTFTINNKTYVQRKGDILLIHPNDQHTCYNHGDYLKVFCLHFYINNSVLNKSLSHLQQRLYSPKEYLGQAMQQPIQALYADAQNQTPVNLNESLQTQKNFLELLCVMSNTMNKIDDFAVVDPNIGEDIARQLSEIIDAWVMSPKKPGDYTSSKCKIESLTYQLGISISQANYHFKEVFGVSPRQYLSSAILCEAQRLLLNTTLSINTIAHNLGYKDSATFSQQYKRWTSISPLQYRKKMQKKYLVQR